MVKRDTSKMERHILRTADRLFYGRGIRAVGVDTVAAEAGISKRTLYNHFPSKEALVVAYLRRRMPSEIVPGQTPITDQIGGFFDALEYSFGLDGFRGCPFVNAVTELGEPDDEVRALAVQFKEGYRGWFRALLEAGGADDPESLSLQLLMLVDGAIAAALLRQDSAVAQDAKKAALALVRTAGITDNNEKD
ncbi:TetR/AcrR family transcriptional regulator [Mycobacteroides abscessus]|uniref:TetR/AcrR family transcriptional regulator n=1 Tax=Mycobacteroides abscessus TaxID=36809 RepID=UPI0021071738|nr:TetR/AcrR family transcriptional regulator [Mycobacteroides abscessus]